MLREIERRLERLEQRPKEDYDPVEAILTRAAELESRGNPTDSRDEKLPLFSEIQIIRMAALQMRRRDTSPTGTALP